MPLEEREFETLLDQVRELHRVADELTRSPRIRDYVRARVRWSSAAPPLPKEQRVVADEVVRALTTPRLSSRQSHRLFRAFFERRG